MTEIARLKRNEGIAHRCGMFRLEAKYLMERAALEAELMEPRPEYTECPCCHGTGEYEGDRPRLTEDGFTYWWLCKECDGEGQVRLTDVQEQDEHAGETEREEDRLGRGGWD